MYKIADTSGVCIVFLRCEGHENASLEMSTNIILKYTWGRNLGLMILALASSRLGAVDSLGLSLATCSLEFGSR